jgi:ferredoxin
VASALPAFAGAIVCLATGFCHAAEPTRFAPLDEGSPIVWSVTPLNKGDVIEVHAFNARSGTVVILAICDEECEKPRVVKVIAVYSQTINTVTEKYTLEEAGHLAFWTTRGPRLDFNAGGSKAISDDSKNQVSGVIHSAFSGIYTDTDTLHIIKFERSADHVKVRFDGGSYVTLTRISAAP